MSGEAMTRAAAPGSELVIEHVSKSYGALTALVDVDLSIPPGLFGLLGPNGSGKSTLMRTIATLQRPDRGTIRLGELDVVQEPARLRRVLGYLPQDFGVYPGISARELLDYLARFKGYTERAPRRRLVDELLERVNLTRDAGREVATFSGGMRQRFGIAQALIGKPELLIVDEPTAGLDPAERNRFLRVLADAAERAIVLLSTHIVQDVAIVCKHVAVIARGRIALHGHPRELPAALEGKTWQRRFARELPPGLTPRPLHVQATAEGLLAVAIADESPGPEWEPREPDLEDVYHHSLVTAGVGVEQ